LAARAESRPEIRAAPIWNAGTMLCYKIICLEPVTECRQLVEPPLDADRRISNQLLEHNQVFDIYRRLSAFIFGYFS